MAVALDVLTRPIKIVSGGGVFIAGDNDSNIHHFDISERVWTNLGKLDFDKTEDSYYTGRVQGSSYARVVDAFGDEVSVFVLVGGGGTATAQGIIMASHDGLSWTRVFTFGKDSDTYTGANIFGVVWDKDDHKFYAGGHQSDNSVSWQQETDVLFSSSNGYAWTEVRRVEMRRDLTTVPPQEYPEYITGLLEEHCRSLVQDVNENDVPDGIYGYDMISEILIEPLNPAVIDYIFGTARAFFGSNNVVITGVGLIAVSIPVNTGIPAICVATINGEWMAAGGAFGASASSMAAILTRSEGNPEEGIDPFFWWEIVNPGGGTNPIITLCGGET